MHPNERLDLSALDPTRNHEAWQRLTEVIVRKAVFQHRSKSVSRQVVAWRFPALALSAAAALVTWSAIAWIDPRPRAASDSETLLSQWAARDEVPAGADEILEAFQDDHDRP